MGKSEKKFLVNFLYLSDMNLQEQLYRIKKMMGLHEEVLLAPNGKPSKLSPELYRLVRTPEFKNWFGDWENNPESASKVVDENGEPMVVYHGSPNIFDIFNRQKSRGGVKEFGHYFATNYELAKVYGENVYPAFLNLRKIKIFDANKKTNVEAWNDLEVLASYKLAKNRDAMELLKDGRWGVEKVDGIRADNIADLYLGFYPDEKQVNKFLGTVFLVFDGNENQIKLADGSNTTFNPNSTNIKNE